MHVNMGAVGKKIIDHGFVARCCSEMQRRPAIVVGAVDIESLGLTKRTGNKKCREEVGISPVSLLFGGDVNLRVG
jgi:hypothetical protein